MRVSIENLPVGGRSIRELLPAGWADERLDGLATVRGPGVGVELRVQPVGHEVLLTGSVRATLVYTCDRCLDEAVQEVDAQVTLVLGPPRASDLIEEGDVDIPEEDVDYVPITGPEVELDDLIVEQLVLAVPMVKLCRPDCKGLCPGCGVNLNHEACTCQAVPVDPRWEALTKIKLS